MVTRLVILQILKNQPIANLGIILLKIKANLSITIILGKLFSQLILILVIFHNQVLTEECYISILFYSVYLQHILLTDYKKDYK